MRRMLMREPAPIPRLLLPAVCFFAAVAGPLFSDDGTLKKLDGFLEKNCFECHDDTTAKGDLNLLDLEFQPHDPNNFARWERVFDRVKDGEMPPDKKPRPEPEAKQAFLQNLKKPLIALEEKEKAELGRVKSRRLTRLEYENTVHDLLGIGIPLTSLLPEDPATHGFETVASGQQLSHHNLERYLEAADAALTEAFRRATQGDKQFSKTFTPKQLGSGAGRRGNYRGPDDRDGVLITWPIRLQFFGRMPVTRVPDHGWYEIT
ncbi:MAG: DUF1587 domain-containing protein, partial [Verrucomicrobiales bacterium]|nr:DUF1587 domain-containing protein [Verrucomicrobiales bacterium]